MTNVIDTGPLDWRVAIVDGQGRPSPEFQRRWNTNRNNSELITPTSFGVGAPTATPPVEGAIYWDTSVSPYIDYVGHSGVYVRTSPIGANPTATLSNTASAGTATTFMRSDASPAVQLGSNTQFGLFKTDNLTITSTSGILSVPTATTTALGIVKPDNTTVNIAAGILSVPTATTAALGLVKPDGSTVNIASGVISVPAATTSTLGLVKPDGTTITIAAGVLTAVGGGGGGGGAPGTSGTGVPTALQPNGYIYEDILTGYVYASKQNIGATATVVQVAAQGSSNTATFTVAPTSGNLLVGVCWFGGGVGTLNAGWTAARTISGYFQTMVIVYKYAGVSEPTAQAPYTTGAVSLYEISGAPATWAAALDGSNWQGANGGSPSSGTWSGGTNLIPSQANDLGLFFQQPYASGTVDATLTTDLNTAGTFYMAHKSAPTAGTNVTVNTTLSGATNWNIVGLLLKSGGTTAGYQYLGPVATKSASVALDTQVKSINFTAPLSATTDGAGNITVTAASSGGSSTGEVFSPALASHFPNLYDGSGGTVVATFTDSTTYGLTLGVTTSVGTGAWYMHTKNVTAPASPWSITARLRPNILVNNYWVVGIVLYTSGTGKTTIFGPANNAVNCTVVNRGSVPTGYNSTPYTDTSRLALLEWYRITWDGTNLNYYLSAEGLNWRLVYTETGAAYMGNVDRIGLGMELSTATAPLYLTVPYWTDNA